MPEHAPDNTPVVPGYVVGDRLGAGGFGEVFRARREVIDRAVAIKVLHGKYSDDPDAVARFIAEARAVNKVSHLGIVEIFDFGRLEDGRHYCVMELIEGSTLRDVLRERTRLPLDEALPILRGIADAIDAAHAAGIAHRDLKPDNVFVLPDGSVKLIDFGLAKLTTEATAVTQTGSVFGTPLYMSPEQCRGRAVDVATDRYSFGALAYHVLVGEPPFTGDALELALHHLHDEPVVASKRCPELPARVDAALRALLAKDPADRPATVRSAVDAMAGERQLPRRRRGKRLLAVAVIGTLGAGAFAVWQLRGGPAPAAAWRSRTLSIKADGTVESPSLTADGSAFLFRDNSGWWRHDLAKDVSDALAFPLDDIDHLGHLPDGRFVLGRADRKGMLLYERGTRALEERFVGGQPSPSPDGRSIAGWTPERWLVVHDLATRQTRRLHELTNGVVQDQPKWSPDGTQLLWGRESFDPSGSGGGGNVFVTAVRDGTTRPLDGAAAVAFTRRASTNYFEPITFLRDGRIAYCAGEPAELRARALFGGPEARLASLPPGVSLCQLVSVGDRLVASLGFGRNRAALVPLERKPGQIVQVRMLSFLEMRVAAMGEEHVFGYVDGRYPTTEIDPARPPDLRAIAIDTGATERRRSCPGERSVLVRERDLLHVVQTAENARVVLRLLDDACRVTGEWTFEADSTLSMPQCRATWCAIASGRETQVIVWRLETGRAPIEIARVDRPRGTRLAVAISPDDRHLALLVRPHLHLVPLGGGPPRRLPWEGMPDSIAWGRDPERFIVAGQNLDGARAALVQVQIADGAREQWMQGLQMFAMYTSPRGERAVAMVQTWEQQIVTFERD